MITTILGPVPPTVVDAVSVAASLLTLLCVVPLVVETLRGRAHPSPVTWSVWAAVGMVATFAMALGGAPTPAWLLKGALSLGPVFVAAAAAYKGESWTADQWDRAGLYVGATGTLIYLIALLSGDHSANAALIAVGTAMVVDAVGALPTWHRAWRNPHGELILTYVLALCSVLAVLAILPWPWTLLSASYLVFLAVQMVSIIWMLGWSRHRLRVYTAVVGV